MGKENRIEKKNWFVINMYGYLGLFWLENLIMKISFFIKILDRFFLI